MSDSGTSVRGGIPYTFEHYPRADAEMRVNDRDEFHVVETINLTISTDENLHHNCYVCMSFDDALSLAVTISLEAKEVAEEVIGIRRATRKEIDVWTTFIDSQGK